MLWKKMFRGSGLATTGLIQLNLRVVELELSGLGWSVHELICFSIPSSVT